MKVLFIVPPLSVNRKVKFANHQVPLGFMYMANVLEKEGFKVKILDCPLYYEERRNVGNVDENTDKVGLDNHDIRQEIESFNPDIVGVSCSYSMYEKDSFEVIDLVKAVNKKILVVVGGAHASSNPLKNKNIDLVVKGEGELTMLEIAKNFRDKKDMKHIMGTVGNLPRPLIENLDDYQPAWHLINLEDYFKHPDNSAATMRKPSVTIITSRSCPGNCLAGDTIVHTTEGDIPIKNLVGKKDIGVYTYSTKTKQVFITKSNGCFEMGEKELVRVNFDDGTHIDCTPDHKFLTFNQANQFTKTKEKIKIASNLKFKESVRAIKIYKHKGYNEISWGRRKRKTQHKMIIEYLIGRKLKYPEAIHHINGIRDDNRIENLQLCKNQKEHYNNHPEISERMKKNNPVIHMTTKWRRKITKAITGKKRTYEQRLRYRESKLGTKNPNYKSGLHKHKSRVLQINHKVISVEKIGKQMTYDLSVPETHWFFANKVLVHNCAFCSVQTIWGRKWRAMSANNVVDQIEYLYKKGVKHFRINDDNLTIDKKRIIAICDEIIKRKINIKWDTPSGVAMWALDEEVLTAMKKSGYYRITFGIESGSYDTLKYIGKNIDLDKARNIIATSHKLGLWTASFFIIGFPYETREDIQKTEDFIVNCGVNFPFVFIAQPYAGTKMYEDFKKIGCDVEALSNSTVSKYNTVNFKAEELNEFRKQIYIKFYKKKIWSYCNPITFYKEFLSKIRSLEDLKYTTKMMMAIVTNILY